MDNFEEEAEIEQLIIGIEEVIDGQSPSAAITAIIDVLGQLAICFECTKEEFLQRVNAHLSQTYDEHMSPAEGEHLQ